METTYMFFNGRMDIENVYIYTQGILFSQGKEGNLAICDNTDESRKHYAV